ncbi:hypothetical protein [Schaalia odontolytica]|uniref:Conjugal transfer protein TrbL n=1 Tax=Schaalia odontolytica TaxID=1660 RepID=A0A2X0U260_9ACTO|nr:hypothetical protein [Schaalia odontolytica]WMS26773.1 hypothetical protein RDV55_06720 [Schaalia odontolytica]SPT55859.1 Uncharacterised protein [Schaalia odontolytica]
MGLDSFVSEVTKSLGEIILNLGTWWVKAPVPSLFVTTSPAYRLQDYLRFLLAAVMIASLIVAGIRVVIDGRGESLRHVAQSLVTVVVISGAGLTLASALISIFDETAVWLLDTVTEESAETFGKRIIPALWESTRIPGGTVSVLLLALAGILANVIQMAMIWIRSILLMVIMGLAPIIASTIGTSWGRAWAGKILGFFSGLVLYKLAVSVIYATTILFLTSENGLEGFVSFLVGVMLMVFAAVCPFALVGLLMPTGAMIASSMGGGGGAVAAGAASIASGAVDVVHRGSVAADSAPSSPSGGGGTGSGAPSGATTAPDAGAVGSSGAVGAGNSAAGGAASGAAEGGAAAGSAAAGAATGGATLVAQAVAEGASQAQQGISDLVETSAEGALA